MPDRKDHDKLVQDIARLLMQPVFFAEILAAVDDHPYRAILRAWSSIRTRYALQRDLHGRYWRADSPASAESSQEVAS